MLDLTNERRKWEKARLEVMALKPRNRRQKLIKEALESLVDLMELWHPTAEKRVLEAAPRVFAYFRSAFGQTSADSPPSASTSSRSRRATSTRESSRRS